MTSRYLPIFIVVIALLTISFSACNSQQKDEVKAKQITGEIIKTGSMPMTNLTIKTSETEGFVLECPKDIEKILNENQGSTYTLEYSQEKMVQNRKVLVVSKIIKKVDIIK